MLRDDLAWRRTVLANERTLLAYVRTALALVAAGITMIHFFAGTLWVVIGAFFTSSGLFTGILGIWRYRSARQSLQCAAPPAASPR